MESWVISTPAAATAAAAAAAAAAVFPKQAKTIFFPERGGLMATPFFLFYMKPAPAPGINWGWARENLVDTSLRLAHSGLVRNISFSDVLRPPDNAVPSHRSEQWSNMQASVLAA
jgi:hypothetical protein